MKAGVKYVAEGANMPSTAEAIKVYHDNNVMFGPAKVGAGTNETCAAMFEPKDLFHPHNKHSYAYCRPLQNEYICLCSL